MLKSEYLAIEQKGTLLCSIIEESKYSQNSKGSFNDLADKSILKQFGYSVGKSSHLSVKQRQSILSLLVDCEICTKVAIMSYLDFFIDMRINSSNDYSQAISDWKDDKEFLSGYGMNKNNPLRVKLIRTKW